MGVSIGSRWVNKRYREVSVVVLSEDGESLFCEVSNGSSQYRGEINEEGLRSHYSPDDEFTVDRILTKYGVDGH